MINAGKQPGGRAGPFRVLLRLYSSRDSFVTAFRRRRPRWQWDGGGRGASM